MLERIRDVFRRAKFVMVPILVGGSLLAGLPVSVATAEPARTPVTEAGGDLISVFGQERWCLDVREPGTAGARVVLRDCLLTAPNQRWKFEKGGLVNDSGLWLAVVGGSGGTFADKQETVALTGSGPDKSQYWEYSTADNSIRLFNDRRFCLDVKEGVFKFDQPIIIFFCKNPPNANQRWSLGQSDVSVTTDHPTGSPLKLTPGSSATLTFKTGNDAAYRAAPSVGATLTPDPLLTMTGTGASGWTCSSPATCTASNVAPGSKGTITRTVSVPASAAVGTKYKLHANVKVTGLNDKPGNNDADAFVEVVAWQADLHVIAFPDTVRHMPPAPAVTLGFVLFNAGPDKGENAAMSFTIPAGFTTTAITSDFAGWSCDVSAKKCTSATPMASGDLVRFDITGDVAKNLPGDTVLPVIGKATVGGSSHDPDPVSNTDTGHVKMGPIDLTMTKTGPDEASVGDEITFTLTVANPGYYRVVGATVTDAVPNTVTVTGWTCAVTGGGSCSAASGTGNTVNPKLALDGDAKATIVVKGTVAAAAAGDFITNLAEVTAPAGYDEPDTSNNGDVVDVIVQNLADLSITKTGPAQMEPGQTYPYTLTVTNNGPSNAANVKATDTLDAALTFVSGDGCTHAGQVVTCGPVPLLKTGESKTWTLLVKVAG